MYRTGFRNEELLFVLLSLSNNDSVMSESYPYRFGISALKIDVLKKLNDASY